MQENRIGFLETNRRRFRELLLSVIRNDNFDIFLTRRLSIFTPQERRKDERRNEKKKKRRKKIGLLLGRTKNGVLLQDYIP